MHWIVQNDLYSEEGHASLIRALEVMGLPFSLVKVVPFVHTLEPEPVIASGSKVIALGAYTLITIARERGWTPGTWDLGPTSELPNQIPHWGARLLNHDAWIGLLADVPEVNPSTLGGPNVARPFFLRPLRDSKVFSGKVFDWHEFTEWRANLPPDEGHLNLYTPVLIAPRKIIYAEYRTWVVNGRVVTASQYKSGSTVVYNADVPEFILDFAQECVNLWSPAPAFVLDVAETPLGLRIVETNTLNAAGWYRGNVGKIVEALENLEAL